MTSNQRNRRPLNKDGTIPSCLVCDKPAKKHDERKRWHATCGSKKCWENLRISRMIKTKSSNDFKDIAKKAAIKAVQTQKSKTVNGKTIFDLKYEKIQRANSKIDENGLSGYQKIALKAAPKIRKSNEKNGCWAKLSTKSEFEKYKRAVCREQRKYASNIRNLPNFEKRGPSGNPGAYHLDHRISVWYGFVHKIDPSVIGHICNLQFKPWMDNNKKWSKCDISISDLITMIDAKGKK